MKKFILIAVCLLLVALITLGVCMYAIGENKDISKPYDMGSEITVTPPEDTPEAQKEMENKFSVYNHVTEENGKKILTLFSEEQAEEQWTKRESGEDFCLTYDEILFLIDQSRRLYESYDEIVLTNASEYGIFGEPAPGAYVVKRKDVDPSGLTYMEEQKACAEAAKEVAQIAAYRVAMLDSRMRKAVSVVFGYSGVYGNWNQLYFEGESYTGNGIVEGQYVLWAMVPDDVEWESEEAYRTALKEQLEHSSWGDHVQCVHPQVPYLCLEFSFGAKSIPGWITVLDGSIRALKWGETPESDDRYGPMEHAKNEGALLCPDSSTAPAWELRKSYFKTENASYASVYFSGETNGQRHFNDVAYSFSVETLGDLDTVLKKWNDPKTPRMQAGDLPYFVADLGNGTAVAVIAHHDYPGYAYIFPDDDAGFYLPTIGTHFFSPVYRDPFSETVNATTEFVKCLPEETLHAMWQQFGAAVMKRHWQSVDLMEVKDKSYNGWYATYFRSEGETAWKKYDEAVTSFLNTAKAELGEDMTVEACMALEAYARLEKTCKSMTYYYGFILTECAYFPDSFRAQLMVELLKQNKPKLQARCTKQGLTDPGEIAEAVFADPSCMR